MIQRQRLGNLRDSSRGFTSLALTIAVATTLAGAASRLHAHTGDVDLTVIPTGNIGLLPDTETDPTQDGEVGPLLPMHTMSVHNSLTWKRGAKWPSMLMFHRHSAYRADEVMNPDVVDFLIDNPNPVTGLNAFASPATQFNSAMRRSFRNFCYGGYNIVHDVSQSVPTRILVDHYRELTQLWDMSHPDAFKYRFGAPIHAAAALNETDAMMNVSAFKDMGFSKGLYYDMYCPGFSTLEDGRVVFGGGHDMNSQNGLYRIQIFDPEFETWAPRPISCMRDLYGSDPEDPYYENLLQAEMTRLASEGLPATDIIKFYLPVGDSISGDCDPHDIDPTGYSATYPEIRLQGDGTVTQPGKLTSDMRYARWYPTQITLPGNRFIVYAGWDRDEFEPPTGDTSISNTTTAMQPFFDAKAADPTLYPTLPPTAHLAGFMKSGGDGDFGGSRVKIPVPEIYDAKTDTMIALENARLFHGAWYPNGLVVQTGPKRDDWKVGVNDAIIFEDVPGGATNGSLSDRSFHNMFLIDVQGALKDPNRDVPSVREGLFVTFLSDAANSHTSFTGSSNVMELNSKGEIITHKFTHFGGQRPDTGNSDRIEQIDFAGMSKPFGPVPQWTELEPKLYQPGRQNYGTPLPDGTTVLLGGNGGNRGTAATTASGGAINYSIENHSLHLQHFIPRESVSPMASPTADKMNMLAKSLIPRDEHGIIQLLPDGTVYLGGQNRNGLVRLGDPVAPLGDSDLGVPCGQIFRPPYLFDPATGAPAERPVIVKGPETINYGKPFKISTFTNKGIKSVALIRSGSMSHSVNTDVRYIKLAFKQAGKATTGSINLTAYAPKLPATAVGGYYYLFVVDEAGVPSISKVCVVGGEVDKRIKAVKKAQALAAKQLASAR